VRLITWNCYRYAFVPAAWAPSLTAWIPDEPAGSRRSDHRPLVVDANPAWDIEASLDDASPQDGDVPF
jgi:hypothetical protein